MKNEGATTQPTLASERKTVEMFYEDDLWGRHSKGGLMSYEDFSAALDEFINRNSPAQPVPSAGSKPQEEEDADCEGCNREDCKACAYNEAHPPPDFVTKAGTKIYVSQPVADGGGLPPLPELQGATEDLFTALQRHRKFIAEERIRLASSQEALRVARENTLRLIPAIKHIQGLGNDEEISGEIMLALENLLKSVHRLSPEGSTKS